MKKRGDAARILVLVALLGAILAVAPALAAKAGAGAAVDAYMKIDGIPGEATDAAHRDWMDITGFAFGLTATGRDGSAGHATMTLSVAKNIDKATPKLLLSAAKGQHIREAVIELVRASGERTVLYRITLGEVVIRSVDQGASSGSLSEEIGVSFGEIEWCYYPLSPSGKPTGEVCSSWNLAENRE